MVNTMSKTTTGYVGIEYKSVDTQARASDVNDLGNGMIEAIVSVTNMRDNVNDVILPGAYEKSLKKRTPKGVWHHSWTDPIAKTHEVKELRPGDPLLPKTLPDGKPWPANAGALYVKMEFNLNTDRGKTAYEDVKFFGDSQEWSVGYKVPERKSHRKGGVRYIEELELYEYSPVLFGAMPNARTATVKDAQLAYKSLMQEEGTMNQADELKSALGAFAEQFHDIVVRFADFMGEEKSDGRDEAMSIAEDLDLDTEDFEEFYDAVDDGDHEYAQEKAAAIMDDLEGKSGTRTVALLESMGMELKSMEDDIESKRYTNDDDDDDWDDWDDLIDDEDDDEDDDESNTSAVEKKSIPFDDFEKYLN